jgi:hypothetical protein
MALVDTSVITNRLPKVISPKVHAIIDWSTVGSLALMGALFWKSSKRAAIASWATAAGEATISLLTDYPGGVADVISFPTHGKIDAGTAGAVAMLPTILGFSRETKSLYFRIQGAAIAATTGMTDFEAMQRPHRNVRRRIA